MKVNLGCGPHKLEGWENFDLLYGHDLRKGIPLPDNVVEYIWSEHFIEHLTLEEGTALLADAARVMKHCTTITISTPDLHYLADAYLDFNKFVKAYEPIQDVWAPRTPCDLMNEGMRLWGHQYLYDEMKLSSVLASVGLRCIGRVNRPPYAVRPLCGDLIVSAVKV